MGKRFAAHFGTLDNLSQLASMGFTEAGITAYYGQNPSPAAIHNAGIPTATLNIFNDGSAAASQPGAAGAQYAGYFQSIVSNGWNCIAGEGVGGSVVGTVMNYCTYVNYGGIVGDSQGDMYASPWNHPTSGSHGHWDYIETYNNSNQYRDPSQSIGWSKSAGAGRLGILIMYGPNPAADFNTYVNIIDRNGCDTVLFWSGYSSSSSVCVGLAQQLISHYGTAKDGSTAATTAKAGTTSTTPVVNCPCRHIWLAFQGVNGSSVSQKIEFKLIVAGYAGYVDNNDIVIPGKPYTGLMQLWCKNAKKSWPMFKFWPGKDGHFAFEIGSDTAESRTYSVCFTK
jgi:hypothetical protein